MRTLGFWLCAAVLTLSLIGCGGGGPPVGPSKEAPDMSGAPGTAPEMKTGGKAKK